MQACNSRYIHECKQRNLIHKKKSQYQQLFFIFNFTADICLFSGLGNSISLLATGD